MADRPDPNEPQAQFPDSTYKPAQSTLEMRINTIYGWLEREHIWEEREDGRLLCHACGLYGNPYLLRRGATEDSHAGQRNPDNHVRNVKWLVMQELKRQISLALLPSFPRWPECYKPGPRSGRLWCLICREVVASEYSEDYGVQHDTTHEAWVQVPMARTTLTERRAGRAFGRGRAQRKTAMDLWFESQFGEVRDTTPQQAMTPRQRQAYERMSIVGGDDDPMALHARLDAKEREQKSIYAHMSDGLRPLTPEELEAGIVFVVDDTRKYQTFEELDTLEDQPGGKKLCLGCSLYDQHRYSDNEPDLKANVKRPCRVRACECTTCIPLS